MRSNSIEIKLFSLFVFIFLLGCKAQKATVSVTSGTALTYNMVYGSEVYKCMVEVVETSPERYFTYSLNDGQNTKGSVRMTEDAVLTATELSNLLRGGNQEFTGKTSLWISNGVYDSLKAKKIVTLSFRQGFSLIENEFQLADNQNIIVNIDGKAEALEVLYVKDLSNKELSFWIWDNPNNPLILRMNVGWEMMISDINTKQEK